MKIKHAFRLSLIALTLLTAPLARAEFPKLKNPIRKEFRQPRGSFSLISDWTISPETGEDVVATQLSFRGNFKAREVRWMQIARVQSGPENADYVFKGFQEDRNRARVQGYYMDQDYDLCRNTPARCSYFYRDHYTNPDESVETDNLSQMADFPFGWSILNKISLEACAYNLKEKRYEGCILWGAAWPATGDRRLLNPEFRASPSVIFLQALQKYKQLEHLP